MTAYATVAQYVQDTGDESTPASRVEAVLEQQSAKLRAVCSIGANRALTDDQLSLARLLVTDAARKSLVPVAIGGIGDIAGASQASFTANGFQSSVTLSNPSGAAYFDRSTLAALRRSLGTEQRIGFVWPGGAPC